MFENCGDEPEYIKKQSIGVKPLDVTIGKSVQEVLRIDLDLELSAVKQYKAAIQIAVTEKDNGSRDLSVALLKKMRRAMSTLEAQMHQIKGLGYQRYLTMQMGDRCGRRRHR